LILIIVLGSLVLIVKRRRKLSQKKTVDIDVRTESSGGVQLLNTKIDEVTAPGRYISQGQQENREIVIERFVKAEDSRQSVLQNQQYFSRDQQAIHQTLTRIEGIILEGRAGTFGTSL
jgi:hypothetical protein